MRSFTVSNSPSRRVRIDQVGGGAIDHFVDGRLDGCTNVAAGQPATQSSELWGDGAASRAVDGSGLDGSWGSGSCTHTDATGPTWWQVDLGQVQEVRAVQLVNRADCCQDVSGTTPEESTDMSVVNAARLTRSLYVRYA